MRWLAVLLVLTAPAAADQAHDLAHLRADLETGQSATQILARWCGDLKLADPPAIRAMPVTEKKPASDETRRLLQVSQSQTIRYRKVALTCGTHVLSEADNWYVPDKLTDDMNRQLDQTDTPFGTVVKPLNFHRQNLAVTDRPAAGTVLEVKALLISGAGAPFSLVVEDYKADLLGR